jgi:hypothetical protein
MKLEYSIYSPGLLMEFYEEGLGALGSLCERTWHDRIHVVAGDKAAALWNADGGMHEVELSFIPEDAASARDAGCEVFPGCALTFRLAEALRPSPLALERLVLANADAVRPPEAAVAEKLWRGQHPDTRKWRLGGPFVSTFHFSLLALVRCEIQAIDQYWSLHRAAVSLPNGEADDELAREIVYAQVAAPNNSEIPFPKPDLAIWQSLLQQTILDELADDLERIRRRQENALRRELDRIDDYFREYAVELSSRTQRSGVKTAKAKNAARLAAAKAEHARRRADQVSRHEIRVQPHVDSLVLVAEPAYRARLAVERLRQTDNIDALFIPRLRRWQF